MHLNINYVTGVAAWNLVILVTWNHGYVSGLSCNVCSPEEMQACESLDITRKLCGAEKGIVFNKCKCCADCGLLSGNLCSELKRCAPKHLCQTYPRGAGSYSSPDSFFTMKRNYCTYG